MHVEHCSHQENFKGVKGIGCLAQFLTRHCHQQRENQLSFISDTNNFMEIQLNESLLAMSIGTRIRHLMGEKRESKNLLRLSR
jgi:hypothetical protein